MHSLGMNRCLPRCRQLGLYQARVHNALAVRALSRPISTDSAASAERTPHPDGDAGKKEEAAKTKQPVKSMAQLDEELRMKLEGRSGEGGAAGLELENGKAVAMKRGVRENMFRLI